MAAVSKPEKLKESVPAKSPPPAKAGWVGVALKWAGRLMLFPLLPFYGVYLLVRFLARGGWGIFWDQFLSFIVGAYKVNPKTREVYWLRGVYYPSIVHYHPMCWAAFTLAGLQYALGMGQEAIALIYFGVFIYCLLAVYGNMPFKSAIFLAFIVFVVVPAVDLGISYIPVLSAKGLAFLGTYNPTWLLERGLLRPSWDLVLWLDASMSPGMLILWGMGWFVFLAKPVFYAWLDNRIELDKHELIMYRFGESEHREPVYFKGCGIYIRDVFEFAFSFGDMSIKTQNRNHRFENLFGWGWWGWSAFNSLVNHQSANESSGKETTQPLDQAEEHEGVRTREEEFDDHQTNGQHSEVQHGQTETGHSTGEEESLTQH